MRRRTATAAVALLTAALLGACGGTDSAGNTSDEGAAAAEPLNRLRIMAPAAPGGGWDQTARAMQQAIEDADLAKSVQVFNVAGAGGTVGLAQLATERDEDLLMVMGLVMVGAVETNQSPATLNDVTPIARLTAEDEIVVVPAESPYQDIGDLVDDLKARGRAVSIAGGSAGGTDHILAGLIAKASGVDPSQLNYVAFSGGGESLAALLGNKVSAGISGVGEYADQIKAGKLRALAVSGPERVDGVDAPTLKEAGVDVELINWRGVVAKGGISEEKRAQLTDLVTQMHDSPAWQEMLDRNGWGDTFLAGAEFGSFVDSEVERIRSVLKDIGLIQ